MQGDLAGAREFLDEDSAGDDPTLLLPLAEIELRSGESGARQEACSARLLARRPRAPRRRRRARLVVCRIESGDDVPCARCGRRRGDGASSEFQEAATSLQEFVARVPGQIPALLKLVEVCVDGGLEQTMYEAQEQLTDAYLAANQAAEARVIAEDLVAREPWEPAHIDRFRRALVMLRVSDPDTLIAERLSGQAPFMAHDPFFDGPEPSPRRRRRPIARGRVAAAGRRSRQPSAADRKRPSAPAESSRRSEPPAGAAGSRPAPASDEIDLTGALGDLDEHGDERRSAEARAPAAVEDASIRRLPGSAPTPRRTPTFRRST